MDKKAFEVLDLISQKPIVLNSTISESLGLGWKDFLTQIKCLEESEYIDEVGVNEFKITEIGLRKLNELKAKKEDEYFKKFIRLVIENAPEYDNFSLYDLSKNLNLTKEERKTFQNISFDIRKHLVDSNIANMYGSNKVTLTDKGRDIKNGTKKIFGITINNDFRDSTIGQVNQSSNFSNSPQTNNIIANNKKPLKRNFMMKSWKLISENKLISSIVFVIILYFIKVIFGVEL